MIGRRGVLGGLLASALAAPAVIRTPGLLMPVKPVRPAVWWWPSENPTCYWVDGTPVSLETFHRSLQAHLQRRWNPVIDAGRLLPQTRSWLNATPADLRGLGYQPLPYAELPRVTPRIYADEFDPLLVPEGGAFVSFDPSRIRA